MSVVMYPNKVVVEKTEQNQKADSSKKTSTLDILKFGLKNPLALGYATGKAMQAGESPSDIAKEVAKGAVMTDKDTLKQVTRIAVIIIVGLIGVMAMLQLLPPGVKEAGGTVKKAVSSGVKKVIL